MATISTLAVEGHTGHEIKATSGVATKTDTVEIELPDNFAALTHVFLGVQMFDVSGDPIVDSAGTFTVTVQMQQTKQYETPTGSVIDATAPVTINWSGNTHKIKVVPASLSDTVTYRVYAIANRT